jgi:hypothetical protein
MSAVKRTTDAIDIFEHTMQGVHTSANRAEIVRFHSERGIVGLSTESAIRPLDDTPAEREVIVKMPRLPPRRRAR